MVSHVTCVDCHIPVDHKDQCRVLNLHLPNMGSLLPTHSTEDHSCTKFAKRVLDKLAWRADEQAKKASNNTTVVTE